MRAILVHADRTAAMPARMESALSLARAGGGHLTVLVDTPIARYVAMDPLGGAQVVSGAINEALAADDAHAVRIEAELGRLGVPFEVVRSEHEPVEALGAAARLADVVVVSRQSGLAGELALAARVPVLTVPDTRPLTFPLARAAVAWDGGNEAAHALRAAVPLLAQAGEVHLVTVTEKPGGFPAAKALAYLAHHGIRAEPVELPREGSTEATLAGAAARLSAQILVMGAYGKSRMREYLFGGVTRHFLKDDTQPALLLAH